MTQVVEGFQNGHGTHTSTPAPMPAPVASTSSLEAMVTAAVTKGLEVHAAKIAELQAAQKNLDDRLTSTRYWSYAAVGLAALPYVIKFGGKLFKGKPANFTQPTV